MSRLWVESAPGRANGRDQGLTFAHYDADRTGETVTAWKRAMELSPDSYRERLLHKAKREMEVEKAIQAEGEQAFYPALPRRVDITRTAALQQELQATLEDDDRDLGRHMPLPGSDLATKPLVTLYFVPPAQYSFRPSFVVALVTTIYMPFFR
jgi:hypothetical protein